MKNCEMENCTNEATTNSTNPDWSGYEVCEECAKHLNSMPVIQDHPELD